jgi:hypothetical protein
MTPQISSEIFADYLKCEYKAYLKLTGRTGQTTEYEKLQDLLLGQYRLRAFEYLFSNRFKNETYLGNVPLSRLRKKEKMGSEKMGHVFILHRLQLIIRV